MAGKGRVENLTPWKPGQSGNPKGRTKNKTFEESVRAVLSENVPNTDVTKREALARLYVDMLFKRHTVMFKEYLDREWPKVVEVAVRGALDAIGLEAALASLPGQDEDGKPEPSRHGSNGSGNGSAG